MAEEELQVGDFNPDTYEHVLPEEPMTLTTTTQTMKKKILSWATQISRCRKSWRRWERRRDPCMNSCKSFLDTYYRQHGRIIEMMDLIKLIMTRRFPEIPSTTREEQDALRDQLMIEARKREMPLQKLDWRIEPPRKSQEG